MSSHWFLHPEWMIVWVTVVYTLMAYLTLKAIKRQADTMETQAKDTRTSANAASVVTAETLASLKRQADSMDLQLQMMKGKDRGRLRIDLDQPLIHPMVLKSMGNVSLYCLSVKIVLEGGSEAVIIDSKELGLICKAGSEPLHRELISGNWPRVINSSNSPHFQYCAVFIDGAQNITGANQDYSEELRTGKRYFLYQAAFRYRDVFGDTWESRIKQRFTFVVIPDDMRAIMKPEILTGRWNDAGEESENSETRQTRYEL
jgi:hypothetical protein